MTKYIVTTRVAMILDADHPSSAIDYFTGVGWEIEESYGNIIFDTANENTATEVFQ